MEERPFTGPLASSMASLRRQLHGLLEIKKIQTREDFTDFMHAAFEDCALNPRKLADRLGVSLSTVHRWIAGTSTPHKAMWPIITDWIKETLVQLEAHKPEDGDGPRPPI